MDLVRRAPRYLFFTGKGGVGKTSCACATAVALAECGRRVLLVSTDPTSKLDRAFEASIGSTPTPVFDAPGLWAVNIDPEAAVRAFRARALGPLRGAVPPAAFARLRERLSHARAPEVAAFDELAELLEVGGPAAACDHVVFDTLPTGRTLRRLPLPAGWTGPSETAGRREPGLGPVADLTTQRFRFSAAASALGDALQTLLVLVVRPERGAIAEAARTSAELESLGLWNQFLVVNGVFRSAVPGDAVAAALERRGRDALAGMPQRLRRLTRLSVPLRGHDIVGLAALRTLFDPAPRHGGAPVDSRPTR